LTISITFLSFDFRIVGRAYIAPFKLFGRHLYIPENVPPRFSSAYCDFLGVQLKVLLPRVSSSHMSSLSPFLHSRFILPNLKPSLQYIDSVQVIQFLMALYRLLGELPQIWGQLGNAGIQFLQKTPPEAVEIRKEIYGILYSIVSEPEFVTKTRWIPEVINVVTCQFSFLHATFLY
jgi:hypothetical protein